MCNALNASTWEWTSTPSSYALLMKGRPFSTSVQSVGMLFLPAATGSTGAKSCTALLCQAELLGAPTVIAAGLLPCPVTGEHDAQLTPVLCMMRPTQLSVCYYWWY